MQLGVHTNLQQLAQRIVEQLRVAAVHLEGLVLVETHTRLRRTVVEDGVIDLAKTELLNLLVPLSVVLRRINRELAEYVLQVFVVSEAKLLVDVINGDLE